MARELIVGGTPFQYPETGNENWGEEATDWAEAVTDLLGSLIPAGFIGETTVSIGDNVTSFTNVTGAVFDFTISRSFTMNYVVTRNNGMVTIAEKGIIEGVWNGSDWEYSINRVGDAGMTFEVTSAGQVRYMSSSMAGTYTGSMTFFANVITAG